MIYIIGSLRNPEIPKLANLLRKEGHEIFDDWASTHEAADEMWRLYEINRGRTYLQALRGEAAKNIFQFDKKHLDAAEAVVLVAPAGRSGHLELGYSLGRGKRGYILLQDSDRWDVMLQFATGIFDNEGDLIYELKDLLGSAMGPQRTSESSSWADRRSGTRDY